MQLVRRALERTFDYPIRRRKSHNKNSEETRIVLGDKKQIAGVSNRNSKQKIVEQKIAYAER